MKTQLLTLFGHRLTIILMLIINIPGTIYGYMWYANQLERTPAQFLLFVPDSPTASLFFVIVLIAFLFKRNLPLIEALAAVTLIKYGVWAVVMNIASFGVGATPHWTNYMLIVSHAGMAIQAIIYAPYFRIQPWHLVIVAMWTLHNDVIDYVYMMHPGLHPYLMPYITEVGYFTFWLSVLSLLIVYILCIRNKTYKLNLL
ncbi:DUF1405 domain-containing protein [Alkalihalophilus sp. As8PL]|uniref:DUF1405 domain-containing protein n=1 Tax=Alkalihalophilus sp. As8PL TaxID=3237103 RepID=A0AB39BUD7_9BACI